eukprot:COSAG02_NODE_23642_length_712_cov_0.972268_1_plen_61_part_10
MRCAAAAGAVRARRGGNGTLGTQWHLRGWLLVASGWWLASVHASGWNAKHHIDGGAESADG